MYPQTQQITLFDALTPVAITSSTDATPIVITATSHGRSVGDRVLIYGHTTNVAANGIFKVIAVGSANAFSIGDEITGVAVAGSGAGAGSGGLCVQAPPVLLVAGMKNVILQVGTTGTATMTLKTVGSLGKDSTNSGPRYDYPNMGATVAPTNPQSFLQVIDLDTGAAINGATGIVVAGADINKTYEVNTNAVKYLTVIPITWSAGAITIKAFLTTNA